MTYIRVRQNELAVISMPSPVWSCCQCWNSWESNITHCYIPQENLLLTNNNVYTLTTGWYFVVFYSFIGWQVILWVISGEIYGLLFEGSSRSSQGSNIDGCPLMYYLGCLLWKYALSWCTWNQNVQYMDNPSDVDVILSFIYNMLSYALFTISYI